MPVRHPKAVRRSATADSGRARDASRSARLVAIFLLGCLGLIAPLLRVASRPETVGGLPLPFVFLFGFWALLIALIAAAVGGGRES